jgi:RNA polymerase sigma-70 factor, ECF subfamily
MATVPDFICLLYYNLMEARSDEALVEAIQEGDVFAFEPLVKRYLKRLHSFVLHIVRDDQAASDVVQESLISLYKTIDRIDTTKKFSIYVFSIARNTAISYLRTRKKQVSLEDVVLIDEDEKLYEGLIAADRRHTVGAALAKLEQKYRKVIRLYYFDDLSYEEIGRVMRIPVNTVRTHLFRAKQILKKLL